VWARVCTATLIWSVSIFFSAKGYRWCARGIHSHSAPPDPREKCSQPTFHIGNTVAQSVDGRAGQAGGVGEVRGGTYLGFTLVKQPMKSTLKHVGIMILLRLLQQKVG